ncbi:MAG: DsbA family protein [Proteobacteria bacterium]|nr:DsbA family protein [Pseudomonadota bacterium]
MTHKNMTMNRILRAAAAGSLALFLSACDSGGGSDSTTSDEAASTDNAADTVAVEAVAGEAAPSGEVQITVHRDANGVATGEITVGNPDAIEMIEYASLTCSHCATHHINIWPQIKKAYVDTGKLKLTFRLFARSPLDEIVSMVPLCAADDRVYPILDLMLSRQDRWLHGENGREILNNLAALVRRTGLSRATFDACIQDQAVLNNVRAMRDVGLNEDNITATPTFILDGESFNTVSFKDFAERIEDAL